MSPQGRYDSGYGRTSGDRNKWQHVQPSGQHRRTDSKNEVNMARTISEVRRVNVPPWVCNTISSFPSPPIASQPGRVLSVSSDLVGRLQVSSLHRNAQPGTSPTDSSSIAEASPRDSPGNLESPALYGSHSTKPFSSNAAHVAGVTVRTALRGPSTMNAIEACISESAVPDPCLRLVFLTFRCLWSSITRVRWNELQLKALAISTAQLLQILDSELHAGRIVESDISPELGNLQKTIGDINSFVAKESRCNFLKLLFSKDDRIGAIESFHRRISSLSAHAFQVSALVIQEWQNQNDSSREADQIALNDRLTELEVNQVKLEEVLDVHHANVVAMMTALKKFIRTRRFGERERRFFSHTLKYLETVTEERVKLERWMVTSFEVEFGPQIGLGGFGEVYKGTWNRSQVALKVLKTETGATPSADLISREIETWSTLRHLHILQFLGASVHDDEPFIVMPFLKNGTAKDYICRHPQCNRLTILHHVSLGLAYLHDNNVIHGDLKALNVLIDDGGRAVLSDFGLSSIKSDANSRSTRVGLISVAGSRNWMSPERILGGRLEKPVDIYAFGMTMFEILTGEVPLGHIEYIDLLELVVRQDVRPQRPEDDQPGWISDELWSLAELCWSKDPNRRPNAAGVCNTISSLPSPAIASQPSRVLSVSSHLVGRLQVSSLHRNAQPGTSPTDSSSIAEASPRDSLTNPESPTLYGSHSTKPFSSKAAHVAGPSTSDIRILGPPSLSNTIHSAPPLTILSSHTTQSSASNTHQVAPNLHHILGPPSPSDAAHPASPSTDHRPHSLIGGMLHVAEPSKSNGPRNFEPPSLNDPLHAARIGTPQVAGSSTNNKLRNIGPPSLNDAVHETRPSTGHSSSSVGGIPQVAGSSTSNKLGHSSLNDTVNETRPSTYHSSYSSAGGTPRVAESSTSKIPHNLGPPPSDVVHAAQPPTGDESYSIRLSTGDTSQLAGPSTSNAPQNLGSLSPSGYVHQVTLSKCHSSSTTSDTSQNPGLSLNDRVCSTQPEIGGTSSLSLRSLRHRPKDSNGSAVDETGTSEALGQTSPSRTTELFGMRSPNAQSRIASPIQELSGFRIDTPGRPIPTCQNTAIEKWTFDDLLERWITRSSDYRKDSQFQDVFLATYMAFSDCLEVFQGLRDCFDAVAISGETAQFRIGRRQSALSAMEYWVTSPYMPINPCVIEQMNAFAKSINSSPIMREKASKILAIVERKEKQRPRIQLPAPVALTGIPVLLERTSKEIAAILTAIEGLMYSSIRPADYITHLRQLDGPDRVAKALAMTEKVTYWVKRELLRPDLVQQRGHILKLFLRTANNCYQMRNFSSVTAIVRALDSEFIQCLNETLGVLGARDRKMLTRLSNFVQSDLAYREAVNSSQDPCIPRLDLHLRDVNVVLPGCFPNPDEECPDWISITGCVALARKMQEIVKLKAPNVSNVQEQERLTFLLQLSRIEVGVRASEELELRSNNLRTQEKIYRESQAGAWEDVGFVV